MLEGLLTSHTVPSRESKRVQMEQFLEIVFASTATLSLQQEARPIKLGELDMGDMFVRGGSQGGMQ